MNDLSRWSPDQDPPRDEALHRLLLAADGPGPGADVDWARLQARVMRGAGRAWWDIVVQWRRVAVAASVAAMLAAGALLWGADTGEEEFAELAPIEDVAPESVALARVVADYPDETVLASLLQTARDEELTAWSAP